MAFFSTKFLTNAKKRGEVHLAFTAYSFSPNRTTLSHPEIFTANYSALKVASLITGCHLTAPSVIMYALTIRPNHWKKNANAVNASKLTSLGSRWHSIPQEYDDDKDN